MQWPLSHGVWVHGTRLIASRLSPQEFKGLAASCRTSVQWKTLKAVIEELRCAENSLRACRHRHAGWPADPLDPHTLHPDAWGTATSACTTCAAAASCSCHRPWRESEALSCWPGTRDSKRGLTTKGMEHYPDLKNSLTICMLTNKVTSEDMTPPPRRP